MSILFSRRRFIAITGSAAGLPLLPRAAGAARAAGGLVVWRGTALGAAASIRLRHSDRTRAERAVAACVDEIRRLERIFSLFDPDSALSRLNRHGRLTAPPHELVTLLDRAAAVSAATGGAFAATVQPLWRRYAGHFARPDADPAGPAVDDLLPLLDWRAVEIGPRKIRFARAGMALTLNGIAQGYVTDRVADRLRAEGFADLLLDLGETRAHGRGPDGRPWRAGLADPADAARLALRIDLHDTALASSGGYGTVFDAGRRFTHLFDPRTGRTAPVARGVSVLAANATTADGYSTAFALMSDAEAAAVARRHGGLRVYVLQGGGVVRLA